jgi:hypothetical protein
LLMELCSRVTDVNEIDLEDVMRQIERRA